MHIIIFYSLLIKMSILNNSEQASMFDKTNKDSLNIDIKTSEKGKLFAKSGKPKKHAKFKDDIQEPHSHASQTMKEPKSQKSVSLEPSLKKQDSQMKVLKQPPPQDDSNIIETPKSIKTIKVKSEKTIQQKLKEIKAKKLQQIGEALEYGPGGKGNSSVPTVVGSVKFLAQMIQNSTKNSIKLDIPETLVFDKKVMHILYIFTNSLGFAQVIELNNDLDTGLQDEQGGDAVVTSETLSRKATAQIIEIGNAWHDQNYADITNQQSQKFRDLFLFPVSVLKVQADATANDVESKMLYFSSSVIDALLENHTRHDFLIQRYVVCRGMSPSIIRCELNIQRYPNINFKKLSEQRDMAAIKEQNRKDAEFQAEQDVLEAEQMFQLTGVRPTVKKYEPMLVEKEETVDIQKELSYVDAPEVNLKVFKVSSRSHFTGQQLKERVVKLAKNPAFIVGAQNNHLIPQLIQVEGPVVRFDEEFLSYILDNNSKLKKLFKEIHMTDEERHARYMRKKMTVDQGESTASENDDQEDFNHLYNPKTKILKSKILSVFFQKIKVVDDTEMLRKQHLYKIQSMLQEDLNNYQTQMAGQFVTQELYFRDSSVIETNSRGGFKTDHEVTRIRDQDTAELRESINQILKMAKKKDKFVKVLVIDFLREAGRQNRNMFMQIKFSDTDGQYAAFEGEKIKPQFQLTSSNTDNQKDFIMNTKPLSQLFDSIQKQERERQAIIDKRNEEELKKKAQEKNNKQSKLKSDTNDEQSKWNFSDKQLFNIPKPTKSKFQKAKDAQLESKYITIKNKHGHFQEQKCAGQFCNIKQYDIQQDIPELYVGIIIKMQDDIVQKEQHHRISWTFGAKDDQILPDIGSIDYEVPNSLILLDEDIKSIWKEQKEIQKEIDSVHKEGLNSKVIDEIYSKFKESFSGQKYMCTTAETKFKRMPVCYNCYKFYFKLGKQIIGSKGQINVNELWKISDPIFNKDKDKELRYNQIIKFMKQQLEGQVKKNVNDLRQKLSKKLLRKKSKPKKSQYKKNPYSKLNKSPNDGNQQQVDENSKGKTAQNLDLKNMVQKLTLDKEGKKTAMPSSRVPGSNKEVMFQLKSGRSDISGQISDKSDKPTKKGQRINNLLDIIFGDNNDVERPVQPTMPSIYERNKKWKSQGPSQESSEKMTADTKRKSYRACKQGSPDKSQNLVSKKPPKKPENQKQFLMPIRQNRPSKGFLFPSERPPLEGFSPFTQERYSQSKQISPMNPLSQSHRLLEPSQFQQDQSLNSQETIPIEDHSKKQLPKIKIELSSSTPSKKAESSEQQYSDKFSKKSEQEKFIARKQPQPQSLFNPLHGQLLQALEDQGHPLSYEQLKQELTQLQCLSPQFNIQKVMEEYLSGKSMAQIAKKQQLLLPNQREILKLRQVQKLKDFHRDKISQKSVFMKKSFSLPTISKDYKFVNQMYEEIPKEMKNSQIEHHLNNEIRTSIKNEQYDSTNKVNLFFKRVNQDVIESIIEQNSINFNTKTKIAQDTYNTGLPTNKWAEYYKAIKLKKMKLKKQRQQRPNFDIPIEQQRLEGLNKHESHKNQDVKYSHILRDSYEKGKTPQRSVSVQNNTKLKLESEAPKRIKIIKVQKMNNNIAGKPQRFKDKDLESQRNFVKLEGKGMRKDGHKLAMLDEQSAKTKETTEGHLTGSEHPDLPQRSKKINQEVKSEQDKLINDGYNNSRSNVQIEVIKHDELESSDEILSESEIAEINMRKSDDLEELESPKHKRGTKIEPVKEEIIEESSSLIKDYYDTSTQKQIISEEVIDSPSVICPFLDHGEKQLQEMIISEEVVDSPSVICPFLDHGEKQITDDQIQREKIIEEMEFDSQIVDASNPVIDSTNPRQEGGEIERLYQKYHSKISSSSNQTSSEYENKGLKQDNSQKPFSLTVTKIKDSSMTETESNNTGAGGSVSHRIVEIQRK